MDEGDFCEKDDRLMADAMHTLKNMITPINAYAEMIQYGHVKAEKLPEVAEKISLSANKAAAMCTELMDIFRVRGKLVDERVKEVSPFQLLREFVNMMENNLYPKQIKVVNELDSSVNVVCNPNMLKSVFMNLITNAIKFSYPHSKIVVSGEKSEKNTYNIYFVDEGVGIDEKKIQEKLDENSSYSTIGTADEQGTGLGLILVKNILEKSGGTIRAYNNKDKGATFVITLAMNKENG